MTVAWNMKTRVDTTTNANNTPNTLGHSGWECSGGVKSSHIVKLHAAGCRSDTDCSLIKTGEAYAWVCPSEISILKLNLRDACCGLLEAGPAAAAARSKIRAADAAVLSTCS